jgi:hypothetical protein
MGADSTEIAPVAKPCAANCQVQNRVRGRAVGVGFPFALPGAVRLAPRFFDGLATCSSRRAPPGLLCALPGISRDLARCARKLMVLDAVFVCPERCLRAVVDADLAENAGQVGLHGGLGDVEPAGDELVG